MYLNVHKLQEIQKRLEPAKKLKHPADLILYNTLFPIPITKLDDQIIFTDGHTRAFTLYSMGFREIPVVWDTDELDTEVYRECVKWCKSANIKTIGDLKSRIIDAKQYKQLWIQPCRELTKKIEKGNSKSVNRFVLLK